MVYVVDDDASLRSALMRLLTAEGYEARTFQCADDFLLEVESLARGCVVLDVNMPGLGGFEVQEVLAQRAITMPVVFLTGQLDLATAPWSRKDCGLELLTKPVEAGDLLAAIRKALASGEPSG